MKNTTIKITATYYEPAANQSVVSTAEVDDVTGARDRFTEHTVCHDDGATECERNAEIDAAVAAYAACAESWTA